MSMNYRKWQIMNMTYIPKNVVKHKHNYTEKYILEITNINPHATSNYYLSKEYHYILKCDKCNSFIPDSTEGNFDGLIFNIEDIDKNMPMLKINTNQKGPLYVFNKLIEPND